MDRSDQWTNPKNLNDFIIFQSSPLAENRHFLKKKYLEEGWSASKIANYCDCSKTYVLSNLKKYGIPKNPKRRTSQIPYGKKLTKDGKLTPYTKEQKVIKMIIQLRNKGLTFETIANELTNKGVPTKKGGKWHQFTVRQIVLRSPFKH